MKADISILDVQVILFFAQIPHLFYFVLSFFFSTELMVNIIHLCKLVTLQNYGIQAHMTSQ